MHNPADIFFSLSFLAIACILIYLTGTEIKRVFCRHSETRIIGVALASLCYFMGGVSFATVSYLLIKSAIQ